MLKIATEEAFSLPEISQELSRICAEGTDTSLDMQLMQLVYGEGRHGENLDFMTHLQNWDERLKDMDANGVDMQLLSLTAPGVQMFEPALAVELAQLANDRLAEQVAAHPDRYAGLASFAPQRPAAAVKEIERARTKLGLHGLVVNSHTNDEYYDDRKYWPIFEAAEALDAAIYIHPRCPSKGMAGPFADYGMDTAMWGYGVETATHALRLILSGLFDEFPKLRIVLGHMGEGIPFWLWRIDYMHKLAVDVGRQPKLGLTPSEYFRRNFAITTSGQENPLALRYSLDMLGDDNVMWAIDYPYQPTAPAVKFMDDAPLDEEVRAKVYGGNAARIFHIGQ
jgi:2,3-dihydroxybenzoate decarboxylase/5-carboxyvanillate decarboxylase